MAGPSRDVELVIRARDEATKAVNAVSDALKVLSGMQQEIGDTAVSSDASLGRLTDTYARLQREIDGLKALSTVAAQLDKASGAMERLETAASTSSERVAQAEARYDQLSAATGRLAREAGLLKTFMESERVASAQTARELALLTEQITKGDKAFNQLAASLTKGTKATEAQRQAYRDQLQVILPLIERQAQLERLQQERSSSLLAMERQYREVNAGIASNTRAVASSEAEVRRANTTQQLLNDNLEQARGAYAQLEAVGQSASQSLGGVALRTEAVASAMSSATKTANELREAMLRQASANGESAVLSGPAAAKEKLIAYREAQAAVTALAVSIRESGGATAEQAAEFELLKIKLAEAKNEYRELIGATEQQFNNRTKGPTELAEAFANLREQAASTTNVLENLSRAEMAVGHAQAEAVATGGQIYRTQQQEMNSLEKLRVLWEDLTVQVRNSNAAARDAAMAERESATSAKTAGESLSGLKSQVMGLAGAYLGLIGAMQAVKGVIDTYRTLEQAQAQLTAAHGGDKNAAASDMRYLQGEAGRLGFSLKDLTEQYGKLAIAANQNNIQNQTTRAVFTSVAEGARLVGLDSTATANALYGFVRMIDTGKMSARDFRSVMIQIPGAQRAMNAAFAETSGRVNVTTQEFRKMQKSAEGIQVTDALLRSFAAHLHDQFATELPFALHTFNAEWGRFQTNLQESQDLVGKSGFMDALADQLRRLNEFMKSDEGQSYFQKIGHALADLVKVIGMVASHAGALKTAFEFLLAVKAAEWIMAIAAAGRGAYVTFQTLVFAVRAYAAGAATAAEASAMLGAAMGGLPLLLGAVVFAVTQLASSTTDLTDTFDTNDRVMDKVMQAWEDAGESADKFRDKLKDLNAQQIQNSLWDLNQKKRELDAGPVTGAQRVYNTLAENSTLQSVDVQVASLKAGKISVDEFTAALHKMQDAGILNPQAAERLKEWGKNWSEVNTRIAQTRAALDAANGKLTDADRATLNLKSSMDALKDAIPVSALNEFNQGLNNLEKGIPALAKAAAMQAELSQAAKDRESAREAVGGDKGDKAELAKIEAAYNARLAQIQGTYALDQAQSGRYHGGLTPRARNGGDNSDYVVDSKEGVISRHLGKSADAPLTMADLKAFHDAYLITEGSHTNNVGNMKIPGTNSFQSYRSRQEGDAAIMRQIELDYSRGQNTIRKLVEGLPSSGSQRGPSAGGSGAAWVRAVLGQEGVKVAGGDLHSLPTRSATEAVAGDIVILKGGQAGIARTGVGDSIYDSDGNVRVQTGNNKVRSVRPDSVVGFRRTPTLAEADDQAYKLQTENKKFQKEVQDAIVKSIADANASKIDPRQLYIQRALDPFDKRAADGSVSYGKGQRSQLATLFGQAYDQQQAAEDSKRLDEIKAKYDETFAEGKKLTAQEIALAELKAKGFKTTADGKPATAAGQQAYQLELDIANRVKQRDEAQNLSGLGEQLTQAKDQYAEAIKNGKTGDAAEAKKQIEDINAQIKAGLPAAIAYFQSIGDTKAVAQLQKINQETENLKTSFITADQINQQFAAGGVSVFDAMGKGMAQFIRGTTNITGVFRDMRNAFLQFASDFLKNIADMIMKAEILKALNGGSLGGSGGGADGGSGGVGGFLSGLLNSGMSAMMGGAAAGDSAAAGIASIGATSIAETGASSSIMTNMLAAAAFHSGGIIGTPSGLTRNVDPAIFASAKRFHTGGVAGLDPDEVPIIAKRNEEMLTESDPRHRNNGGLGQSAPNIKVINAIDSGHMLSEALGTSHGERAFVNYIRSNKGTINGALK